MRQIILDTETTGLEPASGHRIIEIGCVEMVDRKLTGNRFHVYLNPEREVDAGAAEVHGLTTQFLADKPRFSDIAEDLVEFIQGTELIIHNAPFDVGFINHEFSLLSGQSKTLGDYCGILDTLIMARRKHPGQRNSLDALCRRYKIDNQHRTLHGALLDAEILAEVYLAMTGGQTQLLLEPVGDPPSAVSLSSGPYHAARKGDRPPLRIIRCNQVELQQHEEKLASIDQASQGHCLWLHPLPSSDCEPG